MVQFLPAFLSEISASSEVKESHGGPEKHLILYGSAYTSTKATPVVPFTPPTIAVNAELLAGSVIRIADSKSLVGARPLSMISWRLSAFIQLSLDAIN